MYAVPSAQADASVCRHVGIASALSNPIACLNRNGGTTLHDNSSLSLLSIDQRCAPCARCSGDRQGCRSPTSWAERRVHARQHRPDHRCAARLFAEFFAVTLCRPHRPPTATDATARRTAPLALGMDPRLLCRPCRHGTRLAQHLGLASSSRHAEGWLSLAGGYQIPLL